MMMSEFLAEVLTLSFLFMIIGFYAVYRAKKAQSEHEKNVADYDKNLLNFAQILGVQNYIDLVKFDEILAQALKEKLIFMVYGYIRVSTDRQTVENQRFEIKNFCKKETQFFRYFF